MDKARFESIVSAYGGDPRRWPQGERVDAERFAQGEPGAAALLQDAMELDRKLDSAAEQPDVTLTATRIVRRFVSRRAFSALASPSSPSFWAMAASAVIGLALGFGTGAMTPPASADSLQALSSAFQSPYEANEEFGG